MNDVHVDIVPIAELREPLREIGHRGIDRAADQKLRVRGARGAANDIDDGALRRLQQWPEQPGEPHAAEEFQRKAVEPDGIGQIEEGSRARGARIVDEHVAAPESFLDPFEQPFAGLQGAQIASDRERFRPFRRDRFGGGGQIGLGRGSEHGLGAFARECERNAAADAAAPARDDDDLPLEFFRHFPFSIVARASLLSLGMMRKRP